MEEIQEAKIIEKATLVKPEFKSEIKAEIKSVGQIEDNIQEVKEYALKLANYYEKIVFNEETLKEATNEKADVNKFKKKVADFRKEITRKWNSPLEKFTAESKETEKILENTYDSINSQVTHYQNEQKEIKREKNKKFFYEYAESKDIDFLTYEQANINITLNLSDKKANEEAALFIDKVVDDINLINTQDNVDEVMIEYKKDLNVSRAITEVKNRHVELEKVQQEKENKKEQMLTDEEMLNKIECLSAPKVVDSNDRQESGQQEEIISISYRVIGPKSKVADYVKDFVKDMEERGLEYEQIK